MLKKMLLLALSCTQISANKAVPNKYIFKRIYERNSWSHPESRSGEGSTLERTQELRRILPKLFEKLEIKTVLDAGCGDFNWMKTLDISGLDHYFGIDIVQQLIINNIEQFQTKKCHFSLGDVTQDTLPQVDLIMCRDCLQHLRHEDVVKAFANFKESRSKFILISNFGGVEENSDIAPEDQNKLPRIAYRNWFKPPYNFPEPIFEMTEGYDNKQICLWIIGDLPSL